MYPGELHLTMITIQAHRGAIGSYFIKVHFLSSIGMGNILLYGKKKSELRAIKGGFIKIFDHLNFNIMLVVIYVRVIMQAIIYRK